MFTGLVEEQGIIQTINAQGQGKVFTILGQKILSDLSLGDSVAVDGVCTTVVDIVDNTFKMEASPETLDKTTINQYEVGQAVNLERPLTPSDRIGGHFVTGHVDGTAVMLDKIQQGDYWEFTFRVLDNELANIMIPKGSIAINGISLTINSVKGSVWTVMIIPHTYEVTNIGQLEPDKLVNVEMDMLGKYVQQLMPAYLQQATVNANKGKIYEGVWFNMPEKPSNY